MELFHAIGSTGLACLLLPAVNMQVSATLAAVKAMDACPAGSIIRQFPGQPWLGLEDLTQEA